MPPCFGSAASAAPQIASKADITAANLRTLGMLFSLLVGLVSVLADWRGP
jgi:hypothetical protein